MRDDIMLEVRMERSEFLNLDIQAEIPVLGRCDLPRSTTDPRNTVNPTPDRYAYLEMEIGGAPLRCGSERGRAIIERYENDIRTLLARSAVMKKTVIE